jgi:Amt family ammonium transporter
MVIKALWLCLVATLALAAAVPALAETDSAEVSISRISDGSSLEQGLNTVWVLIAAFLVFFMQAGFGMVEAGFIRAKNTCNILTKNFLDFCMASLGFFLIGYALMFGNGNGFAGAKGWCLLSLEPTANGIPLYAFWLFQAAFCGAAATTFIYPVVGHWIWGGGWLAKMGFADFAGSTVVHTVGGFAALVGTSMLRPREGKYAIDGKPNVIAGHNIPLASLGVFILWFGWFGFNAGSTLSVGNGSLIGRVAINTNLAAALGGVAAMLTVWKRFGKPDLSMAMNGALAGLVAITAPCAYVEPWIALIIGMVAGYIVVRGVELLDKLQIDDPVGAFPVHGICGIWGTLCVGIFGKASLGLANNGFIYSGNPMQIGIQLVGSVSAIAFVVVGMSIIFKLIDLTVGLRISRVEELQGLDIGEHGMEAYGGFQIFSTM